MSDNMSTCRTELTAKAVKRHMKDILMNSTFLMLLIFSFVTDLLLAHISDSAVDALVAEFSKLSFEISSF